jgi:hypothetical protein
MPQHTTIHHIWQLSLPLNLISLLPLQGDISNPLKQGVVPRAITRLGQGIAAAACQQGALFTVSILGGVLRVVAPCFHTPCKITNPTPLAQLLAAFLIKIVTRVPFNQFIHD